MTREERENAIRCLKLWIEKEPYLQTYKTCLEALEQSMPTMVYPQVDGITPTVVAQADGEYISKTSVLDTLYNFSVEHGKDYERVRKHINELPSVAIPNKVGHWKLLDECSNAGYYCSECKKRVVKEGWSETVKRIKFCPNCGAKMN